MTTNTTALAPTTNLSPFAGQRVVVSTVAHGERYTMTGRVERIWHSAAFAGVGVFFHSDNLRDGRTTLGLAYDTDTIEVEAT